MGVPALMRGHVRARQERLLGDDGHPRKVKPEEDPFQMGLVLEWVYGTIVSTAEKARDGAKRPLGARPHQPRSTAGLTDACEVWQTSVCLRCRNATL
jgi:hypothetical protein